MATSKTTTGATGTKTGTAKTPVQPVFTPTPEAKAKSRQFRIIALAMWVVAIALEAVAIFWVLRPSVDEMAAAHGFPQWRWWLLIGFLVVIAVLAIVGSQLWKKSNRLDPASKKQPVRFFVQNQLGAIIALIAFVPLIVLIFLNKDMDGKQKGIAGGIGVVLAIGAMLAGINFHPLSQEQAWVESQVVTQLTGQDEVWWAPTGTVMHLCAGASDLKNSTGVQSGTVAQAFAATNKMQGITLKLDQEYTQCFPGKPVPDNMSDLIAWVQQARSARAGGATTAPTDANS